MIPSPQQRRTIVLMTSESEYETETDSDRDSKKVITTTAWSPSTMTATTRIRVIPAFTAPLLPFHSLPTHPPMPPRFSHRPTSRPRSPFTSHLCFPMTLAPPPSCKEIFSRVLLRPVHFVGPPCRFPPSSSSLSPHLQRSTTGTANGSGASSQCQRPAFGRCLPPATALLASDDRFAAACDPYRPANVRPPPAFRRRPLFNRRRPSRAASCRRGSAPSDCDRPRCQAAAIASLPLLCFPTPWEAVSVEPPPATWLPVPAATVALTHAVCDGPRWRRRPFRHCL